MVSVCQVLTVIKCPFRQHCYRYSHLTNGLCYVMAIPPYPHLPSWLHSWLTHLSLTRDKVTRLPISLTTIMTVVTLALLMKSTHPSAKQVWLTLSPHIFRCVFLGTTTTLQPRRMYDRPSYASRACELRRAHIAKPKKKLKNQNLPYWILETVFVEIQVRAVTRRQPMVPEYPSKRHSLLTQENKKK